METETLLDSLFDAILTGDRAETVALVGAALDAGIDPATLLEDAMMAAMQEVGRLFEGGEYFVPEMVLAARAMQKGLDVLRPHLRHEDLPVQGRVVIGTVEGDMHDIGKNLVVMMLEGAGFLVQDLGVDVKPARFVEAVQSAAPDIVALSALLNTTVSSMTKTVEALREAGMRGRVKVLVGGAPLSPSIAAAVGADAWAPDAAAAVRAAQGLLAPTGDER